MKSIIIKPLAKSDVEAILEEIRSESSDYMKNLNPYNWKDESFTNAVLHKKKDQFNGIFINNIPVGFSMLRGLDEGYDIPSYAVWISRKYHSFGLASLALNHAYTVCKINGIKTMMVKIHPKNIKCIKYHENFGFRYNRNDISSDHMIYHIEII